MGADDRHRGDGRGGVFEENGSLVRGHAVFSMERNWHERSNLAPKWISPAESLGKSGQTGMSGSPLALSGADQSEKLVPRLLIVTEGTKHGAGDGLAMLLFHAAHLHAEMAGFDNHADPLRSDFFLDGLRDLAGHALLNLQPARKHIHDARNLAEPQHTLVWQIGHVGLAEERQQVVFAEAEEFDVLHDDHLVVGHAERRAV